MSSNYDHENDGTESLIQIGAEFIYLKWLGFLAEQSYDRTRGHFATFSYENKHSVEMLDLTEYQHRLANVTHDFQPIISAIHRDILAFARSKGVRDADLPKIYRAAQKLGVPADFLFMLR